MKLTKRQRVLMAMKYLAKVNPAKYKIWYKNGELILGKEAGFSRYISYWPIASTSGCLTTEDL